MKIMFVIGLGLIILWTFLYLLQFFGPPIYWTFPEMWSFVTLLSGIICISLPIIVSVLE